MESNSTAQALSSSNHNFNVTVVIPAHNAEEHVTRAVKSAMCQTTSPAEIIVVDDGSTDDTSKRVRESEDPRVRLLWREAAGPGGYAARNVGIAAALSEWIAFLDADDEWLDSHIETLGRLHAGFSDAGLLSASWRVVGANIQTRGNHYVQRYGGEGEQELTLNAFLSRWSRGAAPVWTSAACVRRDVLEAVGGFPEDRCTRGGDADTWLRIMLTGTSEAYSPEITAIYHRDVEGSVTREFYPQVRHCTGSTIADALSQRGRWNRRTRYLLKRLANVHKKDPLRKKARYQGLELGDLYGFYPTAAPGFFFMSLVLAFLPHRLVRRVLTVRDRTVSMQSKS